MVPIPIFLNNGFIESYGIKFDVHWIKRYLWDLFTCWSKILHLRVKDLSRIRKTTLDRRNLKLWEKGQRSLRRLSWRKARPYHPSRPTRYRPPPQFLPLCLRKRYCQGLFRIFCFQSNTIILRLFCGCFRRVSE